MAKFHNPQESFSKDWWEKFLEDSDGMKKPLSYHNVFENSELIEQEILQIFKNINHDYYPFRVWVDGKKNEEYPKKIIDDKPLNQDSIESWAKRNFGDKKFGIILNHGESYTRMLREIVFNSFRQLFELYGYPIEGIDFTIFIGNYGFTPLGIHIDNKGENVFHFHLGPGEKTIHIWDKAKEDLVGLNDKDEIRKATSHTDYQLRFGKGDFFYMPWHYLHIGETHGFSTGLSIWLNRPPKEKFSRRMINTVFQEFYESQTKDKSNDILDLTKDITSTKITNEVINTFPKEIQNMTFGNVMGSAIKDFQYCIKSNRGFAQELKIPFDMETLKMNSSISIDYPYRIEYYIDTELDKIKLFIKGKKVEYKYHEDMVSIIDNLNSNKTKIVGDILKDKFTEYPEGLGLRFLDIIYNYKGIVVR